MSSTRWGRSVAIALALFALVGCQAYPRYSYEPRPATQSVEVGDEPVRVLATVQGVREPAGEDATPYLEIRLRVDNDTHVEARLDPASLSAVTADLQRLDLLSTQPVGVVTVAPGGVELLHARFALPPKPDDELDLSGISLRWTLHVGDQAFSRDMQFRGQRRYRGGYDPWHDPRYDSWYGPAYDPWYHGHGPYWRSGWRFHSGVGVGF